MKEVGREDAMEVGNYKTEENEVREEKREPGQKEMRRRIAGELSYYCSCCSCCCCCHQTICQAPTKLALNSQSRSLTALCC